MVSISPPFARVLGRDYARELPKEELSLLTGAVLCSRPNLIRLDGNYRRQARASQSVYRRRRGTGDCGGTHVEVNFVGVHVRGEPGSASLTPIDNIGPASWPC